MGVIKQPDKVSIQQLQQILTSREYIQLLTKGFICNQNTSNILNIQMAKKIVPAVSGQGLYHRGTGHLDKPPCSRDGLAI